MSDRETKDWVRGSSWWVNSSDLSFSEIVIGSTVPEKWARFDIASEKFGIELIRPVNRYVLELYPKPELVSITNNLVHLRQRTHAEIWVKPQEDDSVYALDKTWQRQFYPSLNKMDIDGCFLPTYRFYTPWVIDKSIPVFVSNVSDEETPFVCESKVLKDVELVKDGQYIDTDFVSFKIKNTGKYLVGGKYGIIDIGTAMYDMFFKLEEEDMKALRIQYNG